MVADWVRERISIEDIMGAAPPQGNSMSHRVMTTAGDGYPSSQKTPPAGAAGGLASTDGLVSAENREDKVKACNASHSRRAYHLRKLEMVVQHEHCAILEKNRTPTSGGKRNAWKILYSKPSK
jgi:hypothetical protein